MEMILSLQKMAPGRNDTAARDGNSSGCPCSVVSWVNCSVDTTDPGTTGG